ncbi:uncharacterized protein LOC132189461 [Corylus avellana]|uniref:uncharacterized protein LOC132189461 n=1 Tax=Corylus avellana TaxID=13451 RepID=UPI00286B2AA7|nr:uncharacterized protein LOC132189461 [Corylus avellana]
MTLKMKIEMEQAFYDLLKTVYWGRYVRVRNVRNDGEVDCVACQKPISAGPAFEHGDQDLYCHFSCLNAPTNYKALLFHFGLDHDRLIFTEEVKSDGKEDVLCLGCEKPVLGPGYKCSTSNCNLLLHKSCVELSPQIQQHPFHPNHTLILVEPDKKYCNFCGKNCNRYPFYRCSKCDFNLDITCTSTRPRINNIEDCLHAFIPFFQNNHFTCKVCGEEAKEYLASLCSICQLLIHGKCARFPRIIWISRHDHSLAITYSLQVKEHLDSNVFCKLCYQKVKTEYAAYYCKECDYVAHLDCVFEDGESEKHMFMPKKSIALAADVMEVEGAAQIQHFSHQHDLFLGNEELADVKFCDGCMEFISTPFYSCMQCNFFLHSRCARLPRKKQHILHQHQLTLVSKVPEYNGLFRCDACHTLHHGFAYRCDMCNFNFDLQCCSILETLKHESHQHFLFLPVKSNRRCHACNRPSNKEPDVHKFVFVCTSCDFALGLECATLPLVARKHKYDDHLLKLTYIAKDHCEEYYCLICERERDPNHWFYYCAECDFHAHPLCVLGKYPYIKFGSTIEVEVLHQHPLTFVSKIESSPPCDSCGKTFDGLAVECTQCKSNVHLDSSCIAKITTKVVSK